MPPSHSALAICLRCQCRYARNFRIPAYARRFTSLPSPKPYVDLKSSYEVLILEPLAPRRAPYSLMNFQEEVGAEALEEVSGRLLKHEEDTVDFHIEIALMKPAATRVSQERYDQLAQQLWKASLKFQLLEFYRKEAGDGKNAPRISASHTKREIIDAILKDRWGVVAADEIAQQVDLLIDREIQSTRRDVFFMLGKDGRLLRDWSQRFQARIRVNVRTAMIHVNASQQNLEKLQKAMENLLIDVIEEDFDMSWATRLGGFNEQFIPPVARITGTYIEKKDDSTLWVSALESDSLHDARRLLVTSFDLQLRSSRSLLCSAAIQQDPPRGALYPVCQESALPWNFRGTEWGRWRNIKKRVTRVENIGRESGVLNGPRRVSPDIFADLGNGVKLGDVFGLRDHQALMEHQSEVSIETEAMLGYLLHDNSQPQPEEPLTATNFIQNHDRLRILLNDVPGFSHVTQDLQPTLHPSTPAADLELSSNDLEATPYHTCILKFLPSPWVHSKSFDQYPPLELKLQINPPSGELHSPSLIAIHSESITDIMCPGEECDARFRRRAIVPLGVENEYSETDAAPGITQWEMEKYLSECSLNLLAHLKLKASPHISVTLPGWMISSPPEGENRDTAAPKQDLPRTVQYIAAGLEYRREAAFEWNGLKLCQTVVNGGITGGIKTEIKLAWGNTSVSASASLESRRVTEVEDDKLMGETTAGTAAEVVAQAAGETALLVVAETKVHTAAEPDVETETAAEPELEPRTTPVTSPNPPPTNPKQEEADRNSFLSFLARTGELITSLSGLIDSKAWRFTTRSSEAIPPISNSRGRGRGRGRGQSRTTRDSMGTRGRGHRGDVAEE